MDPGKQQQVVGLGRLGWSLRRIEAATGVRRETASAYLNAAGVAVRGRGRPGAGAAKPAISPGVSTDPPVPARAQSRAPSASACEAYRELIVDALGRGRNAMAIWQDLVDDHGFTARYASVRRFVGQLRAGPPVEARVVITTAPGEEAQVDYGEGPMVRDAGTGKYRRARLFVLTLGYSRKAVRLLTMSSSTQVWAKLHERAFRRLGGAPRVVVLDNLKEGVLRPDIYEPTLNPLYREVLAHYGVVAVPCRIRNPDRKGKVESSVGHAQRTPLRGLRFETLDAAQAYLDRWEAHWADTRIHGTTKRQVAAMFAEEQPALQPLPLEPFRYYRHGLRTVHLDGCVEVEAAYYSVPPRLDRPACPGAMDRPPRPCPGAHDRRASCASTCARSAAGTASTTATAHPALRQRRWPCSPAPATPARICMPCVPPSKPAKACRRRPAHPRRPQSRKAARPRRSADEAATALDLKAPNYRFLRRCLERQFRRRTHAPASRPPHPSS